MAAPNRSAFVQKLTPLAIAWEQRTGIPAEMYLAIAASESNWGNAGTALFGVKGKGTAGSLRSPTWESVNGQRVDAVDDFRTYNNANEAFQGFWDFLHDNPRYAGALKLLPDNPHAFLQAINQAGYATDPKWASSIESIATNQITPMMPKGGKTMGQMREGTPPTLDPSVIDAAINGDTGGGFVPDGEVGTVGASAPPAGATSPTNQMNGNDILQLIVDKLGPPVSTAPINPTTKTTGGAFGPTTSPNKQPTYRYTWANGKTLDIAALDTGPVVKGGTALAVLASGSSPTVKTFPDGSLRQEDPSQPLGSSARWVTIAEPPANKADPAPKTVSTKAGTFQWIPGTGYSLIPGTGPANVQVHTMPDGSLQQYDPDTGQWTMIQPRYVDPNEAAYKKALTQEAQLNAQKTQRGLRPTAQAAIADTWATIDAIQKQIASGQITPTEGDALMSQVHQGLTATLAGTTLFEQQKQAQDTATQRANQATSLLNQRVQSSASLGSSLFSAATGHVMLPKGQATLGIDPMAIANQEVNTMGGGQATGDAAAAFLKSVLGGGGGAPPPGPGGPMPGQPAATQFPTTREAVLAQYPELAQAGQPQPAGTTFVPPNFEATASDVPLTVLPPRPMSPTNQRIQAGG